MAMFGKCGKIHIMGGGAKLWTFFLLGAKLFWSFFVYGVKSTVVVL